MKYQLLALDLDGTLTNSRKEIHTIDQRCSDRHSEKRKKSWY